jgi:2'-5' RNA ligase
MSDRFLCVMASYDEQTEQVLSGIQQKLTAQGFQGEQTKGLPQHITLATFPLAEEAAVAALVQAVAAETPEFALTFNHIGIFSGGRVLFLAPDPNRELLALKERFDPSYNWTPHTTMLIDAPKTVCAALPVVAGCFAAFTGRVTALHLYEFWPTRWIASHALRR